MRGITSVRLKGDAVFCPICERSASTFLTDERICAFCGARSRQRFLWLYIKEQIKPGESILHFAPEHYLTEKLSKLECVTYLSADLDSAQADVLVDLESSDDVRQKLATAAPSVIMISHVFEHLRDDVGSLARLLGILATNGRLLFQVPVDINRSETYEDWELTSRKERLAAFGQEDHVRIYGADFIERLSAAGPIKSHSPRDFFSSEEIQRMGLSSQSFDSDTIHICMAPTLSRAARTSAP